jgi:PKD repeat protein
LFPTSFDGNRNLFLVHDGLRLVLAADYNPGDTSITVHKNDLMMNNFPPSGLITLTEQCSEAEERAISFFYSSHTDTTFDGIEILPEFTDGVKPANITNVTMNVMDKHHNHLKDALIAIEEFIGVKGTEDDEPFGPTMEGRINFLRRIVLCPKAWFSVNKTIGLVPFEVEFTNLCFRLGTDGNAGNVVFEWNFGDNTASQISIIEVVSEVPVNVVNVLVDNETGGVISKTYTTPGVYDVSLKATNDFCSDTVVFPGLITARIAAPDPAIVEYIPATGQILTPGYPVGGPFVTTPVIRAVTNSIINIEIQSGVNPSTGRTYSGEAVNGSGFPIDPIVEYTWDIPDDQLHSNSRNTKAIFGIGGMYDMVLRVDTSFGAYRITSYKNSFDIIEKTNLWLWTFGTGTTIKSYEFGLLSETFKTKSGISVPIGLNNNFLNGVANEDKQKFEFRRNNGFAPIGTQQSGSQGQGLLYWASGRNASDPVGSEQINLMQYTGFTDTYIVQDSIARQWNWVAFNSLNNLYFILGTMPSYPPFTSPTNQSRISMSLATLDYAVDYLTTSNYDNGSDELMNNKANYDGGGVAVDGDFSVYRSAWHEDNGFFLRNDGVGAFFRIRDFYKTEEVGGIEFKNITKLPPMAGPAKLEGQLVSLTPGLFFFNNTGQLSVFNAATSVWQTNTGTNISQFRALQDSTVINFDSDENTLLATSDGDNVAYLSYDYSTKAFMTFNAVTTTFTSLNPRPSGEQWQMSVY